MAPCCRGTKGKTEPRRLELEGALGSPLVLPRCFSEEAGAHREEVDVPRGSGGQSRCLTPGQALSLHTVV